MEAVSFGDVHNVLLNVPPGFMKPNYEKALVLTKRGRIRLRDVIVGDEILTHRGRYRRVDVVHIQGELPLLEVRTQNGRSNKTAPDHPYLTTQGWVQAKDLRVGDVLAAVAPSEEGFGSQVTPEEARLLGYMVGDGSCTHHPTFTNADEEILSDFVRCAKACGLYIAERPISPSKPKNYKAKILALNGAGSWLKKHGLSGKDSYEKSIPPLVLSSSSSVIANFLGAYWSCDGQIVVRHSGKRGSIYVSNATTVSQDLAADLQHALLRLGINARIRKRARVKETKRQPGGVYKYFHVQTCSHEDTVLFKNMPGLCSRKNMGLLPLTRQRFVHGPLFEDEIVSIEESGVGKCRCLSVREDHSFTAGDLAVHNSLLTNCFFPAWEWGPRNQPHLRYVTFSYAASLTLRDNARFRDLILSPEYQEMWGGGFKALKIGEEKVTNDKTGWKLASSVGGVGTGERGDRVICDDPHNVKESESDRVRQETIRWFQESMSNRLNDLEQSSIIVIMQRVHEADVSGMIVTEGLDYCHLLIKMEYDPSFYPSDYEGTEIGWFDPRTKEGELAWPERFPAKNLEQFKKRPFMWSGQYQQSPSPRGGSIILREYWQLWPSDQFPPCEYVLAILDSAYTEKQENDPSAFTVLGLFRDTAGNPKIVLLYAWEGRLEIHDLVEAMGAVCSTDEIPKDRRQDILATLNKGTLQISDIPRFPVDRIIIEAKASGISVGQELGRLYGNSGRFGVELIDPTKWGDKVARMYAVQPMFADGMIYAPDRQYADMVINQVTSFPKAAHDDLSDTISMGLRYLRMTGLLLRKDEQARETAEQLTFRSREKPLYG